MTSLFCPQCGSKISGEFKFCPNCGEKLPEAAAGGERGESDNQSVENTGSQQERPGDMSEVLRCPTCGFENPPGTKACESCGSFVGAVTPEHVEKPITTPKVKVPPVEKEVPKKQSRPKEGSKKVHKHSARKQDAPATGGFHLETYQTVAIAAAILIGGIFIYGLMSSKSAPPVGGSAPSQQSSSSGQPSASVLHEINRLKEVVNKEPNDVASLLQLSNTLEDNGFYDQAAVYYKRYLGKVPKNVDARVDYGVTLFEGGNTQGAITEIKDALKMDPKHQKGLFNLGVIYLNSGELEKSNTAFKECVKVDPNSETGQKAQQILKEHANITSQEVN